MINLNTIIWGVFLEKSYNYHLHNNDIEQTLDFMI